MFSKISYPKIFLSSLIFAILVVQQMVGILPQLPITITVAYGILTLLRYSLTEYNRVYNHMLLFICYLAFALLIMSPPEIFNSWLRLGLYATIVLTVFPLVSNKYLDIFRYYCLNIIIVMFITLSCISFFCYYEGINYMTYEAELEFSEKGGLFGGLMTHSIILGIASGISICALTFYTITRNWKYAMLIIPCFGSLMFSASRGAIIATIAGCLIMILQLIRNRSYKKRALRFLIISLLGIALAITYTNITDGIESKFLNRDEGGLFSSRETKINHRIDEFCSSPIVGIGFSAIDINGGDEYNTHTGVIEPGSSWFAILSMSGIIGLIFVILMLYKGAKNLKESKADYKYLLIALFIFFIFSMYSEGYIFAGGSSLCALLWLTLGQCISANNIDNK